MVGPGEEFRLYLLALLFRLPPTLFLFFGYYCIDTIETYWNA
jgi:hypothetical protein